MELEEWGDGGCLFDDADACARSILADEAGPPLHSNGASRAPATCLAGARAYHEYRPMPYVYLARYKYRTVDQELNSARSGARVSGARH
eukprot:SAG31_NODE_1227_length_9239_cov_29.041904_3_plen_89_part_00